jgi:hypothetical protein
MIHSSPHTATTPTTLLIWLVYTVIFNGPCADNKPAAYRSRVPLVFA